MLISPAYAQAAGAGEASPLVTFLPLILIFVVFYFLLLRPQQKKVKQHRAMVEALRRGDRVVTAGGLIGTVSKVSTDAELQLEIAEGVRVRVLRHTIQDVLTRSEPAEPGKGEGAKAKEEGNGKPTDGASAAQAAKPKAGWSTLLGNRDKK